MLEEKLDLLTKETVALRKAVEANTAAMGATSGGKPAAADSTDKPKRGRPAKAEATPEHDKDEVDAIIRRVSKEIGKPVAKKIIADQGADDLADLLTMPAKFDAAYAAAEAALEEPEEPAEEEDDI
jgi:hypothetical protein